MSGTSDRNWKSYDSAKGLRIVELDLPADPSQFDDLLKFSACEDVEVRGITVLAGSREDAIDAVRGRNYLFADCLVLGNVTIKGAIEGWTLDGNHHAGTVEVGQFDNYWYPGRPPTRGGKIIDCAGLVRLWLWDAEMPEISGCTVKIVRVPKWIWLPYFLVRYLAVRLQGIRTS
jgi:hypothetical protein